MSKKTIFIGVSILLSAAFLIAFKNVPALPWKKENPQYEQMYNKEQNDFVLSSTHDSLAWARVKEFIRINNPMLCRVEECAVTDDRIERKQFPEGYSYWILVTRQRKADSSHYKVKIIYEKREDTKWEQKMALYIKTGISENSFKKG